MAKTLLLAVVVVVGLLQVAPVRGEGFAEESIRHVIEQQQAAWNRGDVEQFMQAYERSERTEFIGKTIVYGYDKILTRYKRIYATPAEMGKLTFSDLDTRMLGNHYAVVTGRYHLERTAADGGETAGIFSLTFQKTADGWKIIVDHTS